VNQSNLKGPYLIAKKKGILKFRRKKQKEKSSTHLFWLYIQLIFSMR
tara:strand:+ start:381 stop:521 length:141 start_codon:yes stop_codon:yes gene_type:complete